MSETTIEQASLRQLVPHTGSMCLLDAVEAWDEHSVRCRAISHRDAGNPLRRGGQLAALHLVEYAAQATAVHGGLRAAGHSPVAAMLASARNVQLSVTRLDDIAAPLQIDAKVLLGDASGWLYEFAVSAAGRALACGRLSVMVTGA